MSAQVLVAYSSKYGATKEIAEKIGEVLVGTGVKAEVMPIDRVKDVASYDAVIAGSAVYAGFWRKDAAEFLKSNEIKLAEKPVWLFSTGPTGEGDPVQLMKGWRFPDSLRSVADAIGPRDIAFFHGLLDIGKLNLGEKLIVKGIKAPIGDFRDWDAIEKWAIAVAKDVR